MARSRRELVVAAIRWSVASLCWALLVGVAAVVAGISAGSLALIGFGATTVLDASASTVLIWRFRHEQSGGDVDTVERRAAAGIGILLGLLAVYLAAGAIHALASHSEPEKTDVGIVLTGASVLVLPWLALAKLRLAGPLGSAGLRGDGILSLAGAALAAATLISLVLSSELDWWWADAVAALIISAFLLVETARLRIELRRSP